MADRCLDITSQVIAFWVLSLESLLPKSSRVFDALADFLWLRTEQLHLNWFKYLISVFHRVNSNALQTFLAMYPQECFFPSPLLLSAKCEKHGLLVASVWAFPSDLWSFRHNSLAYTAPPHLFLLLNDIETIITGSVSLSLLFLSSQALFSPDNSIFWVSAVWV